MARLKLVDSPTSKVEWIVSVAMLNEGWDAKNVFQIVPHEERAFNSKLLIAQVLGRGLRRPEGWDGRRPGRDRVQPRCVVRPHQAFGQRGVWKLSGGCRHRYLPGSPYHFDLHNLDYTREENVTEYTKKGEYDLLKAGYVDLPSQVEAEDISIEFERAVTGEHSKFTTRLQHKTYSGRRDCRTDVPAIKVH